jgi:hypothetical protein
LHILLLRSKNHPPHFPPYLPKTQKLAGGYTNPPLDSPATCVEKLLPDDWLITVYLEIATKRKELSSSSSSIHWSLNFSFTHETLKSYLATIATKLKESSIYIPPPRAPLLFLLHSRNPKIAASPIGICGAAKKKRQAMKISPNSSEQMRKTREQKSNLACNENKHRATKKNHNSGEVRDGAQWWHSNNNNNNNNNNSSLQNYKNCKLGMVLQKPITWWWKVASFSCAIILFEKLDDDDDDDDNHQNKFYDDDNFNNFQIRKRIAFGDDRKKERKKACACFCLFVCLFVLWAWQKLGLGGGCIYVAGENQPTIWC